MPPKKVTKEERESAVDELLRFANSKFLEKVFQEDPDMVSDSEKLNDADYKNRAMEAELFYNKHFSKVLSALTVKLLKEMAFDMVSRKENEVVRGMMIAYERVQKWFEDQINVSQSRFDKDPEGSTAENPLPPTGSIES